jgi:hypothetical protein
MRAFIALYEKLDTNTIKNGTRETDFHIFHPLVDFLNAKTKAQAMRKAIAIN